MELYNYIPATGIITANTSDILIQVQNEYKAVFGQDLVVTPDTVQGILINVEVLARINTILNNIALANQINPNLAGGIFLDALWSLTGGSRSIGEYSTVSCSVAGQPGIVIPTTFSIQDDNGNLFSPVYAVTLDSNGNGTVLLQAQETGPIAVPPDTFSITQVVQGVLGLETISNSAAGTLGQNVQSDESAREERRNTLALQGWGLAEAVISKLNTLPGVTPKPTFIENVSWEAQVINNVTMLPKSIYVCIAGGDNNDIAAALTEKKGGGCGYTNGASDNPVSVAYTNPISGQVIPVLFDRPNLIAIVTRVTISARSSILSPQDAVVAAILAYAAGELSEEPGFIVGASVSPWELAGAINRQYPGIFVHKVEIGTSPSDYSTDEKVLQVFEQATIVASAINVVIQ